MHFSKQRRTRKSSSPKSTVVWKKKRGVSEKSRQDDEELLRSYVKQRSKNASSNLHHRVIDVSNEYNLSARSRRGDKDLLRDGQEEGDETSVTAGEDVFDKLRKLGQQDAPSKQTSKKQRPRTTHLRHRSHLRKRPRRRRLDAWPQRRDATTWLTKRPRKSHELLSYTGASTTKTTRERTSGDVVSLSQALCGLDRESISIESSPPRHSKPEHVTNTDKTTWSVSKDANTTTSSSWKTHLAMKSATIVKSSLQTPSPSRMRRTQTRGGAPRSKKLRAAQSLCGTGPVSVLLKSIFRKLESDVSMFAHAVERERRQTQRSLFDVRNDRPFTTFRVNTSEPRRCGHHVVMSCSIVDMKREDKRPHPDTDDEASGITLKVGVDVDVMLSQEAVNAMTSSGTLSLGQKLRVYAPWDVVRVKCANTHGLLMLCTDLCHLDDDDDEKGTHREEDRGEG